MERMRYDGPDPNLQGEVTGLGHLQELTPDRQQKGRTRLDDEADYAVKAHTHLWVVTVVHKASDAILDAHDGRSSDQPILDVDTILGPPALGCYVCETPYEPRLRRRKCPGMPG